ncbi:hypothetical protein V5799_003097 [Amblyomma americanum]|uniref:Uncharacterized protein n=1 Tax=Amblyomma americanum TaxID=6943 RepID=A0AAQ4D9Y2_AMBAM
MQVGALVCARLGSARRWPAVVVTEFPFVARDQLHLAACGSAGWLSTESPRKNSPSSIRPPSALECCQTNASWKDPGQRVSAARMRMFTPQI